MVANEVTKEEFARMFSAGKRILVKLGSEWLPGKAIKPVWFHGTVYIRLILDRNRSGGTYRYISWGNREKIKEVSHGS